MAATLTGTPVAVVWAAGADPAGQSITIPADATAVYMYWGFYHATVGHGLASVTLAGNAPSQTFEISTEAGDQGAVGVAAWYNPPTGAQTLDPAWDAAPVEGPVCIVTFVKGGDTTAWRGAGADSQTSTTACSTTITSASGDLVIKFDQRYDVGANPPSLSAGWTNGATTDNNSEHARLSYISASGTTTVCNSEDEDYSTVCAVSIPAASAPAALLTGKLPGRIVHPGFRGPPSFARFIRSPRDTSILAAAGTQTLVQSSTFTNSNAFYAGQVNFRLSQSSTFTNSNAFYAGKVNFRLNQSSTFTNSNAFYAGIANNNNRVIQSSTFTNSNAFYAGRANLLIAQSSRHTNTNLFYAGTLTGADPVISNGGLIPIVKRRVRS